MMQLINPISSTRADKIGIAWFLYSYLRLRSCKLILRYPSKHNHTGIRRYSSISAHADKHTSHRNTHICIKRKYKRCTCMQISHTCNVRHIRTRTYAQALRSCSFTGNGVVIFRRGICLADGIFYRQWIFRRRYILPTGIFTDETICRSDISPPFWFFIYLQCRDDLNSFDF